MRSSLEHLPEAKQRELSRAVEIILEECAGALSRGTSQDKLQGSVSKIILFGSYARGGWVDEPHTLKGYRSDFDILVIVSSKKLAEAPFWDGVTNRLMQDGAIRTPVSVIVHGAREVNNYLAVGQYFFVDIKRDGIVLYEADDRPLAEPKSLSPAEALHLATGHYSSRFGEAQLMLRTAQWQFAQIASAAQWANVATFSLHQAVEHLYSAYLLIKTNYSPPSHNIKFLRGLAEDLDHRLIEAWPRDQQRYIARYNILNEAYVKARYSEHFEISDEALAWLLARTEILQMLVEQACQEHIDVLKRAAGDAR